MINQRGTVDWLCRKAFRLVGEGTACVSRRMIEVEVLNGNEFKGI